MPTVGAVGFVFFVICFLSTREVVQPAKVQRPHLKDLWGSVLRNRPLQIVVAGFFLYGFVAYGRIAVMAFFFQYNIGDLGQFGPFNLVANGAALIGSLLAAFGYVPNVGNEHEGKHMLKVEGTPNTGVNINVDDVIRMLNARDMVPKKIFELMETDDRIVFISSDESAKGTTAAQMKERHLGRVIDVGIAEMNALGVAAGYGLSGKMPFVKSFDAFLSMRATDQLHTDLGYNDLPVRIIATHGGTTAGGGPTHYAICDYAIVDSIPNMTMIAPADAAQAVKVVEASLDYPGPIFMRVARGEEQAVYSEGEDYQYEIGKSIEVRHGTDATVIGAGVGVWLGQQASILLEQEGYSVRVIDMHTIKPLDRDAAAAPARETGAIVSVEDHNINGGLGTLVAAAVAEAGERAIIRKLGIPDEFAVLGYPEGIYKHYGFDVEGVSSAVRQLIKEKRA